MGNAQIEVHSHFSGFGTHTMACPAVSFEPPRLTMTDIRCRIKINITILRQPYPTSLPAVVGRHPEGWCWKSAEGPSPKVTKQGALGDCQQ